MSIEILITSEAQEIRLVFDTGSGQATWFEWTIAPRGSTFRISARNTGLFLVYAFFTSGFRSIVIIFLQALIRVVSFCGTVLIGV